MKIIELKGGLGNQMFQYAFYLYCSQFDICYIDLSLYKNNSFHNGYELERIFSLKPNILSKKSINIFLGNKGILYSFIKFLQKLFLKKHNLVSNKIFNELPFSTFVYKPNEDLYLSGYWQNIEYVNSVHDEIHKLFVFPNLDTENLKIKNLIDLSNSCSIHIRRGDYVFDPILGNICTVEYFNSSIKLLNVQEKKITYFVFSDDLNWVKESIDFEGANFIFVSINKGNDSYKDLQLMSLCKHHILSNSSFSWWGWYLSSKSGRVIGPKYWKILMVMFITKIRC